MTRLTAAALLLMLALPAGAGSASDPGAIPAEPGAVLVRPRGEVVVAPGLAAAAAVDPARTVKVWVFFTDKGILDGAVYAQALARTAAGWNEPTRDRRRALGADLGAGFTDLPVHGPYVDALRSAGFAPHRTSRWLNAISVRVPLRDLEAIAALPFVRYIQPVLIRTGDGPYPVPEPARTEGLHDAATAPDSTLEAWFYGPSYNQLDQIGGLALHRLGYTGAGVRVMMLDTGYKKSHPVFGTCTTIVAERDFISTDPTDPGIYDGNTENEAGDTASQHNHGTGTWATLGGYAPGALIGPAWAAEFVLAKTEYLPAEIRAEEDNYVAALEWGDTLGVDVASASLSYWDFDDGFAYTLADLDGDTAVISIAVDIAVAKGMCVVNSIGNSGPAPSTLGSPSDADSVIAAGAVDSLGTLAGFSSRGPTGDGRIKPELVARGVSTYWAQAWSDAYGPASGTSLSAPLIGGVAALLKEAHPTWTGADIRQALIATADNFATPDNDRGYGLVRAELALAFGGPPEPPRMTLPFALCDPPDSAIVASTSPELIWSASTPAPGDSVAYTLFLDDGTGVDTLDAGADTCLTIVGAAPGDTLTWWVHAVGTEGYTRKSMDTRTVLVDAALAVDPIPTPVRFALRPAFPNPTRSAAAIVFRAPEGVAVTVDVVDVSGRLVRSFPALGRGLDGRITWDGTDTSGRRVPPGVFFYRLTTPEGVFTRKLVRLP